MANSTLKKRVKEWKRLTLEGFKDEAVDYSIKNIIPIKTTEITKEAKRLKIHNTYDLLVIPAGLLSDLYILLINSVKPKNVMFISSKEFVKDGYLQRIQKHTYLNNKNTLVKTLDYNDLSLVSTYRELEKGLEGFKNKKIAIDMTWGKATLLAGAGVYSCLKNLDLLYINSEKWLKKNGLSERGSEKLIKIRNPLKVFGDLGNQYGSILLRNGLFKSSSEIYKTLTGQVEDPREYEIKFLITESYENWGNFQYKSAEKLLNKALLKIEQYGILMEFKDQLKKNREIVEELKVFENANSANHKLLSNNRKIIYLLADLLENAKRKIDTDANAEAYQTLYRIIELISQHRLAKYKISTIIQERNSSLEAISQEYRDATKEVFGIEEEIPYYIGTKSGHLILFLLRDEIYKGLEIKYLKSMFDLLKARDHSFLSHGFGIISSKASSKFYGTTLKLVNNLAELYGINLNRIISSIKSVDMD